MLIGLSGYGQSGDIDDEQQKAVLAATGEQVGLSPAEVDCVVRAYVKHLLHNGSPGTHAG